MLVSQGLHGPSEMREEQGFVGQFSLSGRILVSKQRSSLGCSFSLGFPESCPEIWVCDIWEGFPGRTMTEWGDRLGKGGLAHVQSLLWTIGVHFSRGSHTD